ncbi:MAG: TRAP transporter large permease [Sneathiella sp.]
MLPVTLSVLALLLALSIPVAATLALLGLALDASFSFLPLHRAMGEIAWSTSTEFLLVAIPLFILLGEILLRTGIAERMYQSLSYWLTWLPGGLMHSNIGASALFAATSGSSVATAATIGTLAEPQIKKKNYHERLFLGTLASGGTLGILIPPSINIIIYGALTDTSIPKLYLAGILPGIVLASLFMLTVLIACLVRPSWGGEKEQVSWHLRIAGLVDLLPPLFIFSIVIGSIYLGWATPTESAALGVLTALFLAALYRRLSLCMLREVFEGTMRTTAMVMFIIIAAYFLNFVLAGIGLTQQLTDFISSFGLSSYAMLGLVILFYVILGFFMETLTLMITTIPITAPIVIAAGFDPVWFGILLMILIETALVTPPIGLNLYVVQGIRKSGSINDVILGAIPFVFAMLVMIGLLILFPDMALFLPEWASG